MSALRSVGFTALVVALAASTSIRGSEPDQFSKLKTAMLPRKSISPHERASAVVQLTPDLVLWDAQKKITPTSAGHIYLVEQDNGATAALRPQ